MAIKKPQCSRCHRALTDPFSIAVGMGPECRGGMAKKGWKFPQPKYRVSGGRVVLVGMIGKITPPPAQIEEPSLLLRTSLESEKKEGE